MKKRKALKQVAVLLLIFAMTFTMSENSVFVSAAGKSTKVKISAKKLTLTVGKSKKLKITGENGVCSYMNCCWAPCAVHKTVNGKEKFYIYFTNGGWQMGVVEADSPTGPFQDVKGEALLNASDTSSSPLDPACFIDDDGTAYLTYGGSRGGARIRKLADDMISFAGDEIDLNAPYFFEDSGMNKINGKYYMFYHTMVLQSLLGCSLGYRSTQANEVAINEDGTIEQVKQDREGVSQIKDFNPYQEVSGTTYSNCAGMMSVAPGMDGSRMEAFSDAERYKYSWSLVKGVNFGEVSPKTLKINFTGQTEKETAVKVCVDSLDGAVIAEGKIEADSTGNAELTLPVTEITGKHDLYFELEGNVYHFEKWKFE